MRITPTAFTATLLFLAPAGTVYADCTRGDVVQVGAFSGDTEKNTFGRSCDTVEVERTGSLAGRADQKLVPIGVVTGEPEKDTLGYARAE
ncbi:hypothetical protein FHR70_001093 [Microvirga lupini]|uniref:Porin n=1 Tax=Microvirga lupini TaxID=420324 RepID=A0A7W4YWK0_9HYPH|nr:hypothetical protein [Microvirga lupini]MBB3018053.1 hypothetical protein [Microvirga lupini]